MNAYKNCESDLEAHRGRAKTMEVLLEAVRILQRP